MEKEQDQIELVYELDDDDKIQITEIFFKRVVPKLIRLNARSGNLCCEFAGEKYKYWMIRFRSNGPAFDIVEFEYDEDGAGIDFDL